MTHYLSMLKTEITEFVVSTQYQDLAELNLNSRRREIEIHTQRKEKRPVPNQSHSATKRLNYINSRLGAIERRNLGCGKCEKFHDGICRSFACHTCIKDGHCGMDCKQST